MGGGKILVQITQRVNDKIVRKSYILSFLLSVAVLISFSYSYKEGIMFSVFVFIMVFWLQWATAPNAFRKVVMNEKGIRCGKSYIEWSAVENIHVFRGYVPYSRRWKKADEIIYGKILEYSAGMMIGINTGNDENFTKSPKGIYISCTIKTDRFLKRYCQAYQRYIKENFHSEISEFQSGENNQYFFGNPLVILVCFLINFSITCMIMFITYMIIQSFFWKTIIIGILFHICLWLTFIEEYKDAFLLVKLNEHGIFFENIKIAWDKIVDIREKNEIFSLGPIKIPVGNVIAVNSKVLDQYLERHTCDSIYFYKTKKLDRMLNCSLPNGGKKYSKKLILEKNFLEILRICFKNIEKFDLTEFQKQIQIPVSNIKSALDAYDIIKKAVDSLKSEIRKGNLRVNKSIHERDFKISYDPKEGCWHVYNILSNSTIANVFHALIRKNGDVIAVWHESQH